MSSLATALANIKASSPTSLSASNSHRSSFCAQESISRQSSFSSRQSSFGFAGVRGGNHSNICKFYPQGRCTRGSSCPFRHEQSNIAASSGRRSQSVCKFYLNGNCQRGSFCAFRHEPNDDDISLISLGSGVLLQSSASRPVCKYYANGYCSRGSSCNFLHQITSTNSARVPNAMMQDSSLRHQQTPSVPREKPTIEAIRARAAKAKATEACTPLSSFLSNQAHNEDNVLSVGNQFEQVKISTVETPTAVTSLLTIAQQTSLMNSNSIQTNSYNRTHSFQSADLVHDDITGGTALGQVIDTDSILCCEIPKDSESGTSIFPEGRSSRKFKIETSIPHAYSNPDMSLVDRKYPHSSFEHSPDNDAKPCADKNVKTQPQVSTEQQLTPLNTSPTQVVSPPSGSETTEFIKFLTQEETNLEDSSRLVKATTPRTIRASSFPNKLSSEQVMVQLQTKPSFLDSAAASLVNHQPQLNSDENESAVLTPSPKAYIKQHMESPLPSIAVSPALSSTTIINAQNDGPDVAAKPSTLKTSSLTKASLSTATQPDTSHTSLAAAASKCCSLELPRSKEFTQESTVSSLKPLLTTKSNLASSLSAAATRTLSSEVTSTVKISSLAKASSSSLATPTNTSRSSLSTAAIKYGSRELHSTEATTNSTVSSLKTFLKTEGSSLSAAASRVVSSEVSSKVMSSSLAKASLSTVTSPNTSRSSLTAAPSKYGSRRLARSRDFAQDTTVALMTESDFGSSLSAAGSLAVPLEVPSRVKISSLSKASLSSATPADTSRSSLSAAAASKYSSRDQLSREITNEISVSSLKPFLKTEGSSLSSAASRAVSSEVSSKVKSSSLAKASLSTVTAPSTSRSSLAVVASKGGYRELSRCNDSTKTLSGSSLRPFFTTEGSPPSVISSTSVSSEVPPNVKMSSLAKSSLPKDSTNKAIASSSYSLVQDLAGTDNDSTAESVIRPVSSLPTQTPTTTSPDTFCLDRITHVSKLPFQDQRDNDSSTLDDSRPSSSNVSSEQNLSLPSTALTKSSLSAAESHHIAISNTEMTPKPSTLTPIVPKTILSSSLQNHAASSSLSRKAGHDDLKGAAKISSSSLLGITSEHGTSSATSNFAKSSFAAGVCHSNSSSSFCQKETHLYVHASLDANQEPRGSKTSANASSSTSYLLAAKSSLSAAACQVNTNTSSSQEVTRSAEDDCLESKTEHRGPNRAAQPSRNTSSLLAAAARQSSPYASCLQRATESSKSSHQTSSSEAVSAKAAAMHDWRAKHDAPLHSLSKAPSQQEYQKAADKSPRSSLSVGSSKVQVSSAIAAWESKKAGSSMTYGPTKSSLNWRSTAARSQSQKYAVPEATKSEEFSITNSSSTDVNDSISPKSEVTSLASDLNCRSTSHPLQPSFSPVKVEAPSSTYNSNVDSQLKALLGITEPTLGERIDQKAGVPPKTNKKEPTKRWGDESDSDSD